MHVRRGFAECLGVKAAVVQVASHAQKYFIRLNSLNKKDKRRSSIHDITTPGTAHSGGTPSLSIILIPPMTPLMPMSRTLYLLSNSPAPPFVCILRRPSHNRPSFLPIR